MRISPSRTLALAGVLAAAGAIATSAGASGTMQVHTLAGTGQANFSGDGGPASAAETNDPRGVSIGRDGIFIADTFNHRVRLVRWDGSIVTVAGVGTPGFSGDGGPAAAARLDEPVAVAALPDGGVLIADRANARIRRVRADGTISTALSPHGDSGDYDTGRLQSPQDVALTPGGGFVVADSGADRVFSVDAHGRVQRVAGTAVEGFRGDGGPARDARLDDPHGVAATVNGGYLIADSDNDRIRRVDPRGRISTVAGTGQAGYAGDGGPATDAQLNFPVDVSLVPEGGYVVADSENHTVRQVSTNGTISTIAGTGDAGYNGEGLAPSATQLNQPRGVEAFPDGGLVVGDSANHRVRIVAEPTAVSEPPPPPPEPQVPVTPQVPYTPEMPSLPGSEAPDTPESEAPDTPESEGPPASESEASYVEQARPEELPPAAPPVAGKTMNVGAVSGTVWVWTPRSGLVELDGAASVPVGSVVNAHVGEVRITSAATLHGNPQSAIFHEGAFEVRQARTAQPITELALVGDMSACGKQSGVARGGTAGRGMASISAKARKSSARRGLWGRGHGSFRTRGKHGAATVRGTVWYTADRCEGTFVSVRRGVVAVSDFNSRNTVRVPAGESYLARARSGR